MDLVKKYFPVSMRANDVTGLVISIVLYLIAMVVLAVIGKLIGILPVINVLYGIISWVAGIYCFVGIVLAVLVYLKLLK